MTIFRMTMTVLLFAFALVGCGQSGPLYLPGNPSQVQVPPTQQQQPPAQSEDDDEDEENDDGG